MRQALRMSGPKRRILLNATKQPITFAFLVEGEVDRRIFVISVPGHRPGLDSGGLFLNHVADSLVWEARHRAG